MLAAKYDFIDPIPAEKSVSAGRGPANRNPRSKFMMGNNIARVKVKVCGDCLIDEN